MIDDDQPYSRVVMEQIEQSELYDHITHVSRHESTTYGESNLIENVTECLEAMRLPRVLLFLAELVRNIAENLPAGIGDSAADKYFVVAAQRLMHYWREHDKIRDAE